MIRVIIAGQLSSDRRKRLRLGKGFGQSLRCLYPFGARNFKIFIVIRGISTESFILSLHPASFLFALSSLISFSVNKNFLMNFLKDPLRRNEGWSLPSFCGNREKNGDWNGSYYSWYLRFEGCRGVWGLTMRLVFLVLLKFSTTFFWSNIKLVS